MYRVLVVDDDILIRSRIKFLLSEINTEFEWSGDAPNGQKALEFMEKNTVDIVLMDMCMPVMNGVELAGEIQKHYPDAAMIAISNYNDFEYVQGALRLGVKDYILKHTLDTQTLRQTLESLTGSFNKKKNKKEELSSDSVSAIKNRFVLNLLTGVVKEKKTVTANIRFLELPIGLENLVPVMMRVSYKQAGAYKGDYSLLDFSVTNICSEMLQESKYGVIVPVRDMSYCILLHFDEIFSKSSLQSTIHNILDKVQELLKRFVNMDAAFAVGDLCSTYLELPDSYREAQKRLPERVMHFSGSHSSMEQKKEKSAEHEHSKTTVMSSILSEENTMDAFEDSLMKADRQNAEEKLTQILYNIEANQYDRLATQIVFSEILHVVKNVCKKKMLDFREILPEDLRDMLLEDDVNFEEVRKGFFNTLDAILEKQQERTQVGYSTYTAQAIHMMKKHYATELGLKDVAEKIRISAGYLSTTFKNDTGSSFSEYLMKIRIDKSIEMMENGEQNIRLIAEKCGFNSYEYFFSTFKKIKGETPKKFINRVVLNK